MKPWSYASFGFTVPTTGDYWLSPGIWFDGDPDPARRLARARRAHPDAFLSVVSDKLFYDTPPKTKSGRVIDREWLRNLILAVAEEMPLAKMDGLSEAEVGWQPSYLFAWRSSPRGFLDDLNDIVKIGLHGGAGYPDGRKRYNTVTNVEKPDYFYFGDGANMTYVRKIAALMLECGPILEREPDRITKASEEIVLETIAECSTLTSRRTKGGGLVVFGEPFLEKNIRDLYYSLIEKLAQPR